MLQKGERTIRVGDGYERHVEAVRTLKLILKSGFIMYLKDTLYVPSITRNLISVPKLLLHDYEFMFGYYGLKLYFNSRRVGTGSLENNLIKLQLDSNFEKSLLSMDVNVKENGIVNQFTMPYTPQQNDVAERPKSSNNSYGSEGSLLKRSKGYRFYCRNHTTRIVETRDAEFLENGEISRSGERSIDLNEKLMGAPNQELSIPLYMENSTTVTSNEVVDIPIVDAPPHDENPSPPIVQQQLRRSERTRRPVVHDDFITYFYEDDYDLGKVEDPIFYNEAINSNQSTQWLEAMNDELNSMQINDVWELA
ncbi:retrovirus-related pol polyprotein from transposon TNT 1-94 [Tanacetum coccineum]